MVKLDLGQWKVIAIISIVLNVILVGSIVSYVNYAVNIVNHQDSCINICGTKNYDYYEYDPWDDVCHCFSEEDKNIVEIWIDMGEWK